MTGSVLITVIFADEPDSAWTGGDMTDFRNGLHTATDKLISEARRYGAALDISFHYLRAKTNESITYHNYIEWSAKALKSAGFSDPERAIPTLKKQYSVKEAPILFAVNRGGRAYARTHSAPDGLEFAMLFHRDSDYRHELLHVFGAKDYYYPEETKKAAEKYFPDSIMNVTEKSPVVDPLTAFLVGWTDTLPPSALQFLRDTDWISADYVCDAVKKETISGFATLDHPTTTYTGYLLDGMYHGKGKLVFKATGDSYEGSFANGLYHGKGKFIWKSTGGCYEGSFVCGEATNGTLSWSDGTRYIGDLKEWKMHGRGKYIGANGAVYEGTFVEGNLNGYGVAIWANGTRYVGTFRNWALHGQGTCTFPGGQVQSGLWDDGNFLG